MFHLQVSQDLPFLHPSETSVLNRLSKLGSDYIRFTEFIEQHTGHVHQQVSESGFLQSELLPNVREVALREKVFFLNIFVGVTCT